MRLARGAQLGLIFKLSPFFEGEALAEWLLLEPLKPLFCILKRFWMAPPLLPGAAVTDVQPPLPPTPPPADEEAVLCAGEEPETSDTSVDVDMGESIGAVLVPPPAETGTFCFE